MIKKFDLSGFSKENEIAALAKYAAATWAGITEQEAQAMATLGFSRGWEQQGVGHKGATFNGKQLLILELAMKRDEILEKRGIDYLDYTRDKTRALLKAFGDLAFVTKSRQPDTAITDSTNEVLGTLGDHLKSARPHGWSGEPVNPVDVKTFAGHVYRPAGTYHFLDLIAKDYIQYCVEENHGHAGDANALWELMRGFYNHGRDLRKIHNEENLGKTVKYIDIKGPLLTGDAKIPMAYNAFVYDAFTEGAAVDEKVAKAFASVDWQGLPTERLAASSTIEPN